MAEFRIQIHATVKARNLDSATKKLDAVKQKIERIADCQEVHLIGLPTSKPGVGVE